MSKESKPAKTLAEVRALFQLLKKDIEEAPGCYSTATNPLLRPIYQAWENAQHDPEVEPELKVALESPLSFVKAVAPDAKISPDRMARGLRHRVGMLVTTEIERPSIVTVHKEGWLAGKTKPLPVMNGN